MNAHLMMSPKGFASPNCNTPIVFDSVLLRVLSLCAGPAASGRALDLVACMGCSNSILNSYALGVLFGCFARKIDGDSWFTFWLNHLPEPSISPKRTPMPYARW